jgi:hypothetical protein
MFPNSHRHQIKKKQQQTNKKQTNKKKDRSTPAHMHTKIQVPRFHSGTKKRKEKK